MYSINEVTTSELVIKNSRFITILFPLNNNLNIIDILNNVKKQYPKATHYCYAYITSETEKSSDDGEPSSTAGLPMLSVLKKKNIVNVLAVTVRYFGGIKLGAGGLVRSYTKSVTTALANTRLILMEKALEVEIYVDYSNQKILENILAAAKILEKEFTDKVRYVAIVPINMKEKLATYNFKILNENRYLEKIEY